MIRHQPVLLRESIEALRIEPDGKYVDVTYGGGGHSREILKRLKNGVLVAFDADPDAVKDVTEAENMILIHQNFKHLKRYLQLHDLLPVDGILADLGVSSHQLDTPERGFTYRYDSQLDMRMDKTLKLTAAKVLNEYSQEELQRIFSEYGELENSKTLAKVIVNARANQKIETTGQLRQIIEPVAKGNINQYLSKVFQAVRIEVNKEMDALEELLKQAAEVLKTGGRLVVISYHSLEDRLVKNFMKTGNVNGELLKDVYGNYSVPFKALNKKPIIPSPDEIRKNTRARSAKMRVAERV
ncbi:MAG TPA: 16S rRNA (cytosine(1402)-N(4))-methyltransferase RsmH [Chitinophagales bacterium]|nr:16S rRNA (cytosine(1402)-N(4))-methyltransferase RsmH [Chitinophagales bacterium]